LQSGHGLRTAAIVLMTVLAPIEVPG
jgi:hypothetical protein